MATLIEQVKPLLQRNGIDGLSDLTMADFLERSKGIASAIWSRSTRRMRVLGGLVIFIITAIFLAKPVSNHIDVPIPKISWEYTQKQQSKFNESKVALLIENRADPILAPLMLHFMGVVPPDWRFRFMGSMESVEYINKSMAIRQQVDAGKLDLTYIPSNMTVGSQEEISRFLTNLWLYQTVLAPAEWLLVFQTDSILCANSQHTLNDYLEYDWIGAPWSTTSRYGGNGGLSIRRVSAIVDILSSQVRVDGSEPEDVWLAERLGHRPGSKLANGTVSLTFSGEQLTGVGTKVDPITGKKYNSTIDAAMAGHLVEGIDDWRKGFYEPMGYHTGGRGTFLHSQVWGTPEMRKHIYNYCPEVKMTLRMDAAGYIPGDCNTNWKRDLTMDEILGATDLGHGTEIIDGEEYPLLPASLQPW